MSKKPYLTHWIYLTQRKAVGELKRLKHTLKLTIAKRKYHHDFLSICLAKRLLATWPMRAKYAITMVPN